MRRLTLALIALLALPLHADTRGGIVIDLNLGPLISRLTGRAVDSILNYEPHHCSPIVGYRFSGEAGREFEYARERFAIEDGAIELIADRKRTHIRIDGNEIELGGQPDQFGFVDVELPEVALPKVQRRMR